MPNLLLEFAQLGQLYQQANSQATPVADLEILRGLERLLEPQTGSLERVYEVTIDAADVFRGKAEQRISLGRSQNYSFTITPTQISYKLIDTDKVMAYVESDVGFAEVLDYAAKQAKGAKTNKAQMKLNCKPGNIQCGGKCQNGSLNCYKNMSPEQAAVAKKLARKAKAQTKKTGSQYPNNDPDFAPMYAMAFGADPDSIIVGQTERLLAKTWSQGVVFEKGMSTKMAAIQDETPTVDTDEARALATWLGNGYPEMSRRIWDAASMKAIRSESENKAIMALNVLAAKALHQQSPATVEQITKEATKKGHVFDPEKPLKRWIKIDPPDGYLQKYRNAIGKELVEDNFLGTSHLEDYEMTTFSNASTIEYRVKAKLDGTGQGRYVDHFKNSMKEGEILYPPGAKFKVVNVLDPEPLGDPPKQPSLPKMTAEEQAAFDSYENKKIEAEFSNLDAFLADGNNDAEPDDLTPLEEKMKLAYKNYQQEIVAYNAAKTSYGLKTIKNRYIIELEEI